MSRTPPNRTNSSKSGGKSGSQQSLTPSAIHEDDQFLGSIGDLNFAASEDEIDIVEEGSSSNDDYWNSPQQNQGNNMPFAGNTSFVRRWVDEEDDFDYTRPPMQAERSQSTPMSGISAGNIQRTASAGAAPAAAARMPNRKNMWKQRAQQESVVDQSVNLMDAQTATYQDNNNNNKAKERGMLSRGPAASAGMMGFRQRSLVDIFITDESARGNSRNIGGLGANNRYVKNKNNNNNGGFDESVAHFGDFGYYGKYTSYAYGGEIGAKRRRMCFGAILLLALLVGMAVAVPKYGMVAHHLKGNNNNNNKKEEPPKSEDTTTPKEEDLTPSEPVLVYDNTRPQVNEVEEPNWDDLETSNVPQTSRQDAIRYHIMEQAISDPDELDNKESAQSLALHWLAMEDSAQLLIPGYKEDNDDVDSTKERQLLQRYALAVFYYAMQLGDQQADNTRTRQLQEQQQDGNQEEEEVYYEDTPPVDTKAQENKEAFDLKWCLMDAVCDWPGVTCNDQDEVVMLNVSRSLLQGNLPREITMGAALPQLTVLDVSHNHLYGYLPFVGSYKTHASELNIAPPSNIIQQVYLQHNSLQGNIDPIMDWGDSLTLIDLTGNSISGAIPEDFGSRLTELSVLKLGLNDMGGTLPKELEGMTKLEVLDFEGNDFSGTIPQEWDRLRSLKAFSLSHCEGVRGEIPHYFAEFNSLQSLRLQATSLAGTIPDWLAELTNLQELLLHSTELTGDMPDEVCDMRATGLGTLTSDCDSNIGTVNCDCCTDCYWG